MLSVGVPSASPLDMLASVAMQQRQVLHPRVVYPNHGPIVVPATLPQAFQVAIPRAVSLCRAAEGYLYVDETARAPTEEEPTDAVVLRVLDTRHNETESLVEVHRVFQLPGHAICRRWMPTSEMRRRVETQTYVAQFIIRDKLFVRGGQRVKVWFQGFSQPQLISRKHAESLGLFK